MGNIWAAALMLRTAIDEDIHENATTEKYLTHAHSTSLEVMEKFPKCKMVANTFRLDKNNIQYFTSLYTNGSQFNSKEYACDTVVDRAGSGDCFMAGLIYGTTHKLSPQETVEFATAAAFGKLQEKGDATNQEVQTIYQTIKTGTVQAVAGS
jgi:2-dehydro-3-deoxygluconokinase